MTTTEFLSTLIEVVLDYELCAYTIEDNDGRSALIQTDWDFPALANQLIVVDDETGEPRPIWSPPSNETDGTVDCPVTGKTASEMISEATEALDSHCGCAVYIDADAFENYAGA